MKVPKLINATLFALGILALATLSFGKSTESYQWRAVGQPESDWIQSNRANLGFTEETLEFQISLDRSPYLNEPLVLHLTPTYIDQVFIEFIDAAGHTKQEEVGDKLGLYNFEKYETSGTWVVPVPPEIKRIALRAQSTSNLSMNAEVLTISESQSRLITTTSIRSLIVALIVFSALAALALFVTFKRRLFLAFAAYQFSWVVLLAGIDGIVLQYAQLNLTSNRDQLVSVSVILALISGCWCHGFILKSIFRLKWLSRIIFALSWIGVALLVLLLTGYERIALASNALLLTIFPVVTIVGAFAENPSTSDLRARWRKTRWIYVTLLVTVIGTGVSGLGNGSLFSLTYLHALLTTIILSYIVLDALSHQREVTAAQLLDDALNDASNRILKAQLDDNHALLSMLSHEIKTPLTTIKLLMFGKEGADEVSTQIREIEGVLDQARNVDHLYDSLNHPKPKDVLDIRTAVNEAWSKLAESGLQVTLNNRLPTIGISINHAELAIVLRNLLTNAGKYGCTAGSLRVYSLTTNLGTRHLFFSNCTTNFNPDETNRVFDKYWRSTAAVKKRGTGIGLWISQRICEKYGMKMSAHLRRNRFIIAIELARATSPDV